MGRAVLAPVASGWWRPLNYTPSLGCTVRQTSEEDLGARLHGSFAFTCPTHEDHAFIPVREVADNQGDKHPQEKTSAGANVQAAVTGWYGGLLEEVALERPLETE